ncbi:MAG TPA: serine/threonine-protein kinase [Chloroflexia bacterium]|nr:serine/threonine-protein kinase [Chloroflexia bacterium]
MLIKRLEGVQAAKNGTGPTTEESQAAGAGQTSPYASPARSAHNTEVMPGTGTAPLPRNTVLQGRYDVEEVLGVGGMSTVYKARDLRFTAVTRYCAVKEMPDNSPDIRTGQIRLANFEREASLLATLSHPGIPKIYDFFSVHGRVYLVLEFIDGRDLESQLNNKEHPMLEEEVVRLAVQICDVLEYLHGHSPQPIIFRDLKPSNIIVQPDGKLTLIDFGIAKVFQSDKRGTMIGTEGYAPPEQYRGLAEPRGDIYGLGATMHHLLTKSDPRIQTPFTFHERPIRKFNPRVSEYLESIILQAVEYDIDRRWPSAPAFRQALMQTSVLDPKLKKRQSGPLGDDQAPLIDSAPYPAGSGSAGNSNAMMRPDVSSGVLLPPSYAASKDRASAADKASTPAAMGVGADGAQVLWTFTADDEIRSSPLCSRGVVFFGAYDTNLYALNAKSGDFLWKAPTKAGICSSPTLVNDLVIVGSEDGYVYAFDARRGTTSWIYRTGSPVRSSPKVYKDMLFIGSDDQNIYALQADTGQIMWKYRTWNHVRSSATVANGLVMIGSSDGNLYALDTLSGTLKWKMHTLGAIISTPGIAGNTVIVGSLDNYVYGVDADTGFTSWRFETQRSVSSSPAVMGERVLIGSTDGIMYALDAHSGRTIWDFDTQSQITSSPKVSPVSDSVYFGTVNNYIYSLDLITGEQQWRYRTRGPVVSSASVEDGIVYIGSLDRKLYALAI